MSFQSKSSQSIPILTRYNQKLLLLAEELEKDRKFDDSDYFGCLCIYFLSKQLNHLKSILTLIEAGQFGDATSIARIMIDGMVSLLWVSIDHKKRALDWHTYSLVSDFKLLMKKKKESDPVDPDEEKLLMERLGNECQKFLTKNGRKAFNKGEPLPENPYRAKWLLDSSGKTVQIEDVFSDVGAEVLYQLYSEMSDWVHWNPRGIGSRIHRDQKSVTFTINRPTDAATALASGFQALWQIIQVVNEHLGLNMNKEIEEIKAKYVTDVSSVNA